MPPDITRDAKQQVQSSLVDRRLEEARQRRLAATREAGSDVVGPPEPSTAGAGAGRTAGAQLLTVVFEFIVDQKPPAVVDSPRSGPNVDGAANKEDAAKEQGEEDRPR